MNINGGEKMGRYCPFTNKEIAHVYCQECETKICENNWFYCLVVGSRSFSQYEVMKKYLNKVLANQEKVVIVSGGAKGADELAEKYAEEKGYPLIVMRADWEKYGKSAGFIRNEEMHEFIAKHEKRGCVAFWDGKSKGTAHSFELGKKYGNPVKVCKYDC